MHAVTKQHEAIWSSELEPPLAVFSETKNTSVVSNSDFSSGVEESGKYIITSKLCGLRTYTHYLYMKIMIPTCMSGS